MEIESAPLSTNLNIPNHVESNNKLLLEEIENFLNSLANFVVKCDRDDSKNFIIIQNNNLFLKLHSDFTLEFRNKMEASYNKKKFMFEPWKTDPNDLKKYNSIVIRILHQFIGLNLLREFVFALFANYEQFDMKIIGGDIVILYRDYRERFSWKVFLQLTFCHESNHYLLYVSHYYKEDQKDYSDLIIRITLDKEIAIIFRDAFGDFQLRKITSLGNDINQLHTIIK